MGEAGTLRWGVLIRCGILLTCPLVVSAARLAMEGPSTTWPESWLRAARYGLIGLGVYMFGTAFILEWIFKRSVARLRARGLDPEVLILKSTMAVSVAPSIAALFLSAVGGSVTAVYGWSVASVLTAAFWCIRYRHVLVRAQR